MKKYVLHFLLLLITVSSTAQERLYTDKEHGGANNGIFGKIDDEINVSPIGQLSYEIPIPALPGTGGMKPILSVCYNSSTKNGLAGYGFDLAGLSIISRVPSDLFHDGIATAIDFTSHDHFALDGQRLINYCNTGTEIEYKTENNSFAKIIAKGKSTNPTSFTVYTKSGLIHEYVSVSKALGKAETDSTLFWLESKVSDTKGNYFTITYGGDASTNDFYPLRIDYTGNATTGLSPYASMRFSYTSNNYSPVTYVNGVKVKKSKLLSSIGLYMGAKAVRSFTFSYQIVNRKYQLSLVKESSPEGDYKNSTRLTWANLNDFKVQNYNYSQTNLIHKATLTVGDFNGDGMADFIATPENDRAGWKGWKLFISHGTYFTQAASGAWSWNDDKLEQVVCGDFNGDGYADVVTKRSVSGNWHNCDLYTTSVDKNGNVSLKFSKCFLSLQTDYSIQTIELNGDGAADLFAWLSNSKECKLIRSERGGTNGVTPLGYTAARYCSEKWDRVEFGDFNGDGLTDVMNLNADGNYIMYSDGAGTMTKQDKSTWPNKDHYLELGDFNGDGKTDMLLTGWKRDPNNGGWSNWCINYSKGDGKFVREYYAKPFDARSKQLYIADLNGDGYDDFQAVDKTSSGSNMTQPQAYLSDGNGNFYQQVKGGNVYATDKWHFYVGDFNGDGKVDFVCTSDWNRSNWDGYQVYLMPYDKNSLLTGIKDGLGNSTNIDYKYMTDKNVFTRGNTSSYPLTSVGLSWPVVASVSAPDGIGGTNVTSYQYEDALFHKAGRGLLGFARNHVKDETTNTLNTTEYSVNTQKYLITPKHSQTMVNGKVIEESNYTYTLKTNYATSSYDTSIYTYMPSMVHQKSYEFNTGELIKDVMTSYVYDSWGNATRTNVKDGDIETITTCTFTNNADKWILGRLTETTVSKSNKNGTITRKSSFEYDKNSGLLTAEVFAPENNNLGYRKTYEHDSYGNIIKSTVSPIGSSSERVTRTSYDSKGRYIVSSINSLGFVEITNYDEAAGVALSSKDKNNIVTNYTYDKFGNLLTASTPVSKMLKTTGWSAGMSDAPQNALYFEWNKVTGEPATIKFYDCLGRLLRKVTESVNRKKIYIDQTYNHRGLVEKTSDPYYAGDQSYWSKNEYDAVGRTTAQITPDGSRHTFAYDGLKTTATDPLGSVNTKVNNLNGLLATSIDNAGTTIVYKYNADGKCIETKGPRTTIRCSYDIAGNRITLDDPDLGSSQDSFNAYGELISHKDSHGETHFEYDAGGRIIQETRPDVTISTSYDSSWKGAVDQVESDGSIFSSSAYTYDNFGRLINKHTIIDDKEYETAYTYNSANQVETIKYPGNLKIRNGYDACGIQTSVSNAGGQKLYWKLLNLNARGQIEKEEFGNGLVTTTTYDSKKGTISSIVTPGIQNWTYSFDAVGNLTARRDLRRNLVESLSYDGMYRLTTVRKNGQIIQSITYDNAGNITNKSDVGGYVYEDGSNRLASITDCKRSVATWDEINYNSFDKITQIVSGNKTMLLEYGPDQSRVLSDIQGERKYYVDNLFEQKIEGNKTCNTNYIFAFGKAVAIVSQENNGVSNTKYLHHDHLGSIQTYTDEVGKLYQELSYDAWGLRRSPDTWVVFDIAASVNAYNDHGFGGHEHIDIFELVNMDGRMYDPLVGRFISADPFIQSIDYTQSLNRYAYCINNPLSLIDPSGYSWFSNNWKSITASIVGIAVSVVTAGTASGPGIALIAGSVGGAAGALTGALLNGANIGQVAKNTLVGAVIGGASGILNYGSGEGTFLEKLFKHTFSQGWLEGVQGGDAFHGFMMGAVIGTSGSYISAHADKLSRIEMIAANAIIGGTVSEIGGGKFANGAITGAFSMMFNDLMHHRYIRYTKEKLREIMNYYRDAADLSAESFYQDYLGGEIGEKARQNPEQYNNTCAARLSDALNKSGIIIPNIPDQTYMCKDGSFVFIRAQDMANYFYKAWGKPYRAWGVHYGIVFQKGFTGVSGHVDVFYDSVSGGGAYSYQSRKEIKTYLW